MFLIPVILGGEAYLPMTPTGQSPISSHGLKPAKVVSYLSDDSMSGEFPKRAYSVGSRPTTKPLRHHHIQDLQKKQVLDNSRSSSAPHLIVQKSRGAYLDKYPNPYDAYLGMLKPFKMSCDARKLVFGVSNLV